tara:strand:- start:156 stop:578 length:423 start_codon:yes stop_codon:yes gene_type:complete
MNDFGSILGAGLIVILVVGVVALLVATIVFRAATKWVAQRDISLGMSIAIVILGFIASIVASFPASILLGLFGLPELASAIVSLIVSFSATSCVYSLMLNMIGSDLMKISFWKASLIQIVMLLILFVLIFAVAFAIGGLA